MQSLMQQPRPMGGGLPRLPAEPFRASQGQPKIPKIPSVKARPPSTSPLLSGARSAIEAVNDSRTVKQKPEPEDEGPSFGSNLLNILGRTLSNVSIAQLRSSPVPSARMAGNMMKTIDEQEKEKYYQNLMALAHLDKQQEARRRNDLQLDKLEEYGRHNRAMEARGGARGGGDSYKAETLAEKIRHNKVMEGKGGKEGTLSSKLETRLANINTARRQLESFKNTHNQLKAATEKNLFRTYGAIPGINKVKGFIATRAGEHLPGLSKENVLRSRLISQAARLEPVLERIETDKAPGEQMLKRFHESKVYFSPDDQSPEVIEDRIKDLTNELDNVEASILGGKSSRNVPNEDIEEEDIEVPRQKSTGVSEAAMEAARNILSKSPSARQSPISPEAMEMAKKRMMSGG